MKKKLISTLLCVSMVAAMVAGCGSGDDTKDANNDASNTEGTADADTDTDSGSDSTEVENTITGDPSADDAFVVWGWNDDIKNILDGPFAEQYPDLAKRIVFVNAGGSDYYQTKIDEILDDPDNELYPDLMGLEVDYVLKYVNSDWLTSVGDCGITADDYANQYQYNLDLGTVSGEDSSDANNVKALFWQATPGCFQLRADLCEKYLGTTDPAELSTMFSTWDGDDDVISVDDNMTEYMDLAKTMVDEGLTYETDQWSTDWYANMEGDGETSNAALAYCGCPWFTYWSLKDTWKGNTILVNAPEQFYWGGTGLAATANCADKELAGTIIKAFTCDTDFMVSINAKNSDFVNNKEAVKKISEAGATCDFLYADAGQDIMAFYLPMADSISAKNATAEDQNINASWATQVKEYAAGNKDKDTAIADFKSAVHDSYSYLKAE